MEASSGHEMFRHIDTLRRIVLETRQRWPFHIDAWVVLPEHLHCVWTLPVGDADNSNRWRVIKQGFSKALPITERRSAVHVARGERGIWQRRFWEHVIRDDTDYAAHIDYCHINPVKHGLVSRVADWPYSTFPRYVERGLYPLDWAAPPTFHGVDGEREGLGERDPMRRNTLTLLRPTRIYFIAPRSDRTI
jgi:putative transposase